MEKSMKAKLLLTFITALTLAACGSEGTVGDACAADEDCEDGLECHVEEHDDHEDEDEGHEEEGVCEEADAHDDE
jgi:hypothetical protein